VIGAGLAGVASAIALASRGLDVSIVEADARPRDLPTSLEVLPSMLRDLVRLGVADPCVLSGFAFRGIDVADHRGRRVHEVPTPALAGERFPSAIGIQYGDLHRVLVRAAMDAGARFRWGQAVRELEEVNGDARVLLSDGSVVEADLALLAMGSASPLVTSWFPHAQPPREMGQRWLHALVRRPVGLDRPLTVLGSRARRLNLVPVRAGFAGLALIEPGDVPIAKPASHLREALRCFGASVRALDAQVDDQIEVAVVTVRSALMPPPWHRGPALAIGECAHTLPPHFGQAAAQAIEDACVLGELIAQTRKRDALQSGFQQRRFERVRQIHELTSTAARWDLRPDSSMDLGQLMERLAGMLAVPA
jgi:2-polyprenyl-6-methoxyphenol hydroxylase-like FAD-dependent oxidoreductase